MSTVDRNPDHLYPGFLVRLLAALKEMSDWCEVHAPGVVPILGEGFRSTARQKALYAQGRTAAGPVVTHKDGVRHRSNHQSSMAADLWLKEGDGYDWDGTPALWRYWGHCCRAQGLEWGGDWKSFKDHPHVEWPTGDLAAYKAAREWQKTAGLA